MGKIKRKAPGRGPIAQKTIKALSRQANQKVLDLQVYRHARQNAAELEKTIISEKEMAGLDPLHAIYAYAQNKLSVMVEQLSDLPALSRLVKAYTDAEDVYLPSGPPMSPLTGAYFSCWGFFDLCVGLKKESLATVAIDVGKAMDLDPGLITLFDLMQRSRMGLYLHEGATDGLVCLTEFITNQSVKAIVPAGYSGESGEIWFTRLLPEPFPDQSRGYSLVFITPYILGELNGSRYTTGPVAQWEAFFERTLPKTGIKAPVPAYEKLMKYGLARNYWNAYIMDSFLNSRAEMIMLAGYPDVRASLPHAI
ncbi:hypothetical protein [Desulfosarcina sp.]|uniref:hypothetical protein n=1 Tax=Desulfosarcina sp. TaxID=2027861 RepID=UPI003971009A